MLRPAAAMLPACALVAMLSSAPVALQAQIPISEYATRRDSLAARVGNGVVVGFGGRTLVHDFGRFFQLPAFHYLTGYDEPDAAFVLVARNGKQVSTVFTTKLPARTAFYYGQRADSAELPGLLGIGGRSYAALPSVVDSLVNAGLPLYTLMDFEDADFAGADSLTRGRAFFKGVQARHAGLEVKDAHPLVNQLRARKSDAELALLRRAAEISSEGHRAAMMAAVPQHEYELQAVIEYTFLRLGGERPSYGSIVGSGALGTQLHYMKDRGTTKPGDLVVIDAATQYEGYAADITRTIPVSGTYTTAQRALYQLVRDAQAAAERNSKVGMSTQAASDSSFEVRAKGLAALGLIESVDASYDPPAPANCTRAANCRQANFWMIHGISHGLGLAVHDPMQGSGASGTFKIGDAFTIEPGIYINTRMLDVLPDTPRNRQFIAKARAAAAKYENSGVRIEDDYVITPKGTERISTAPREISEIEALMKQRKRIVP
jgi:Xaa-Pro aminopeptidase